MTVAALATLPAISFNFDSVGGYADMPLAAVMVAVIAACLRLDQRAGKPDLVLAWLLGAMLMVKNEATVLLGATLATLVLIELPSGVRPWLNRLKVAWKPILLTALFVVLRIAYLRWIAIEDLTYLPVNLKNGWRALGLIWPVTLACLRSSLDYTDWILFWPLFFLFGAVVVVKGRKAERGIALGAGLGMLAYGGIFLFTNWDVAAHIRNAYPRLLIHLAPAAALAIICGHRIVGRWLRQKA